MSKRPAKVWIGFDPREAAAFAVARGSIQRWNRHIPVRGLVLSHLQNIGLYYRPTERRLGRLWDVISSAPMSTEFAISRFLVPTLQREGTHEDDVVGWAIFMDCDVLVRCNLTEMISQFDDSKAVMCVKHIHNPTNIEKMDGQVQTAYPRKNWSSVMAINCNHPSNKALSVDMVNQVVGRDLHRFFWLDDDEIGELGPEWNYLVGHTPTEIDAKIVHYTDGGPWLPSFAKVEYADEWFGELERWAV